MVGGISSTVYPKILPLGASASCSPPVAISRLFKMQND